MSNKERYRNVRKTNYTTVSNKFLRNSNVTLQAKGLLTIFLSNNDNWEINMKEIINRSKNGRDAQYKVVNELIEHGYFARVEIRSSENKFEEMEYLFSDEVEDIQEELSRLETWAKENNKKILVEYMDRKDKKKKGKNKDNEEEKPHTDFQDTEKNPHTENQDTGNPYTEITEPESQYINNTNLKNTNLKNTKNNNLNPNHKEFDLYEVLWETKIPQELKNRIKVLLANKIISLSDNQILDIEDAYNYQIQKDYVIPDCAFDDVAGLNDFEFTKTVSKMLKTVKEISNIKGLIKEWVQIAYTYKQEQYRTMDVSSHENIIFYDWLNESATE